MDKYLYTTFNSNISIAHLINKAKISFNGGDVKQ